MSRATQYQRNRALDHRRRRQHAQPWRWHGARTLRDLLHASQTGEPGPTPHHLGTVQVGDSAHLTTAALRDPGATAHEVATALLRLDEAASTSPTHPTIAYPGCFIFDVDAGAYGFFDGLRDMARSLGVAVARWTFRDADDITARAEALGVDPEGAVLAAFRNGHRHETTAHGAA